MRGEGARRRRGSDPVSTERTSSSETEPTADAGAPTEDEIVPRSVRRFVIGFLAMVLLFGFAGIDLWPLSAFKLFSQTRDDRRISWVVTAEDPGGTEEEIQFGELPIAYRAAAGFAKKFVDNNPDEERRVCRAWSEALAASGQQAEAFHVYRLETDVASGDIVLREQVGGCDTP